MDESKMDLNRITAVNDALVVCLDFIRRVDPRQYENLEKSSFGKSKEAQLGLALDCMAVLPHLAGNQSFDYEAVSPFLKIVESIDRGEAEQLRSRLWGSSYDKLVQIRGTAAKLLDLKKEKKKLPLER